jgi:hypothetical protein
MADKKISQLTGATTPLAGTEVLPIVQGGSTVKVSIDNVTKGRTVNATTFDTDVAAAGVTLSGTTLAADGTNTDIDITITPKNSGKVSTKAIWTNSPDGTKQLTFTPGNSSHQILGDYTSGANVPIQIGMYGIPDMLTFNTDGTLSAKNNLKFTDAGDGIDFSANTGAAGMTSELLNWYEEGTWTPTDASGAGLTLTAGGSYTRIGRLVFWQANILYPATADVSNSLIGGLPFSLNAGVSAQGRAGSFITGTDVTALVQSLQIEGTPPTVRPLKVGFVRATNADLSGGTIYIAGFFFV